MVLLLALLTLPALAQGPDLFWSYTAENPLQYLGPQFAQPPVVPFVTVIVSPTPGTDGYLITLAYTDAKGNALTQTQGVKQTPGGAIAFFLTGQASDFKPSAQAFVLTGPVITPKT